jgi:hypothetical protein
MWPREVTVAVRDIHLGFLCALKTDVQCSQQWCVPETKAETFKESFIIRRINNDAIFRADLESVQVPERFSDFAKNLGFLRPKLNRKTIM